jgi:hypothetical protein
LILWVVFRAGIDVFLSAKAEIAVERGHDVAFWSYAVLQESLERGRIDGVEQAA